MRSAKTIAAIAFIFLSPSISTALPGERIEQVISWSEKHSVLPKLSTVKKLERDYPDFRSLTQFQGGDFSFDVYLDEDRTVYSETIDYRTYQGGNKSLNFARDNSSGIALVQDIYGSTVAEDFQNSKYIVELKLAGYLRFYQGQNYAYQTWTADSAHQFTVIPINKLQPVIDSWRRQL